MGTASYVVVGTPAAAETYYSVNHGAGRVLSRHAARETLSEAAVRESLGRVRVAGRLGRLLDEAPAAYKDIALVVATLSDIGLTRQVARILPLAVLKGEGEEA
jgi:tRNA-splicing ligase RtcB